MAKIKQKKKIIRPQYTTKAVRIKKAPKKPVPRELKYGIAFCAVALVAAIVLVIALYNDGSLALNEEGLPVMEANNWLVANKGSSSDPKYYKVGEISPLDGFSVEEDTLEDMSMNMRIYNFLADDPDSQITQYYATATDRPAKDNAETANANYLLYYDSLQISDVRTAAIDGLEVHYFTTASLPSSAQEETEADGTADAAAQEETQSETPQQQLLAYIPAKRDTTILVAVTVSPSEESSVWTEDALLAVLQDITDHIVVDA